MIKAYFNRIYFFLKKFKFSFFSNNGNVKGNFKSNQPVVFRGKGEISFGNNVIIGVVNSPLLYSSYAYIEARTEDSIINIGNNVMINNSFSIVSEKRITIHDDVLIGYNCNISDSNFHNLDVPSRLETDPNPEEVIINKNVFIGNSVTILKGVIIGENSVIAAGSIVTKSVPKNVVVGGVPAKIISTLL